MDEIVKMRDVRFSPELFINYNNRRIALMSASVAFLRRPRDIKEYVDIFAK
ncbi:MAG: hypothetical protein MJY74_04565 [Bacteroidaceae bacterium]|nr:hypothetical protein [Bacteroidaceae bacterium]